MAAAARRGRRRAQFQAERLGDIMTCRLSRRGVAVALLTLPLLSFPAAAELSVSANDGKAVLVDGVNSVPANPPADSVTIIDLAASPPKAIHEIKAPASVVGPPLSVAVAPDESSALVTAATKHDPADPKKTPHDTQHSGT